MEFFLVAGLGSFDAPIPGGPASGLRVSEALALRPADIDSRRMTILVAPGKGNKFV